MRKATLIGVLGAWVFTIAVLAFAYAVDPTNLEGLVTGTIEDKIIIVLTFLVFTGIIGGGFGSYVDYEIENADRKY